MGRNAFPLGGRCLRPCPQTDEGLRFRGGPSTDGIGKPAPHQPPAGGCFPQGGSQKSLFRQLLQQRTAGIPQLLAQVNTLWDEVKRFENPHRYYVDLSQKLWDTRSALLKKLSK